MVRGVEKFKEYFRKYTGHYTFIGGTACDILLGNLGENFRATKDLDIVLLIEALNEDFGKYVSAILLDDEYYMLLKNGVRVVEEVSVLDLEHIILFKMKAWLDLSKEKEDGEHIDSKNIKKHKNDIFRLAASVDVDSKLFISGQIKRDAETFLDKVREEPVDLNSLNIRNTSYNELLEVIARCYDL